MATLLAATLLVGGCGGGDEPEAEPTPILPSSSSAEPSSSPSSPSSPSESEAAEEAAPEMPEAAREESTAGAEAFIDYWTEVFNFATVTGDTAGFEAVSAEGCRACTNISRSLNRLYGRGGRIESEGWTVKQIGFASEETASMPAVRFDRARERVFRTENAQPEVFTPEDMTYTFELERVASGWRVLELTEAS
ncbi:DUF6318 family protein [Nocardioides sp. CFH 31398]|uniref:DUF6318 family protein n=1 Tax=Nocardioides sp. CFH 31398 TaxID=2919579 RepID=UPI001F070E68|nr:DUF6318 family protein [Nocardioides sp. CFH 31398]MCH1868101.1 DUF6318 family protein [Nocardioides sp. CFH 31398]